MLANNHIQSLKPYNPTAHKIWNLTQTNVLKLDWNEASIPPSPNVFKELQDFLQYGHLNWYPHTKNIELLESICAYTNQKSIDYIALFGGSDVAHECILDVFLQEGDSLLILTPTYDNLRARAQGVGIKTIAFELENDFSLDFTKLKDFLSKNSTKMVYICNPNNPSGAIYPQDEILNLLKDFSHIMFLIDEAYYEFCNESLETYTHIFTNLIITRTFSKAFALASFRIGYILSHCENVAFINKLRNAKNINMPSQIAALAALKDINYTQKYIEECIKARAYFISQLDSMSIKTYPSFANFVLLHTIHTKALCAFLESKNIFIRDYSHIIENHCRITIGTMGQMRIVAQAIKEFIRGL